MQYFVILSDVIGIELLITKTKTKYYQMNKTNIANINRFKSWLNRTCKEVLCDDGTPFYEDNKHYTKECSSAKDEFCNLLGDDAFWTLASDAEDPDGQDEYGISNDVIYAEEQIDIAFDEACI